MTDYLFDFSTGKLSQNPKVSHIQLKKIYNTTPLAGSYTCPLSVSNRGFLCPPLVQDERWYEEFGGDFCVPYGNEGGIRCYDDLKNFSVFSCLINDPEKGLGPFSFLGGKSGNWAAAATVTTKFLSSPNDKLKFVNLTMVNKVSAKETNLTEGDWVFIQGDIQVNGKNYMLYVSHPKTTDNSFPLSSWKLQLVNDTNNNVWGPISFTATVDFQLCNPTCPPITDCGDCTVFPKQGPSPGPSPSPTPGPSPSPTPGPSPSPTPGPSPSPTPSPESRGLSTPAIIGISIGGVALVVGIGLVIMNLVKKKRKGRKK